MNSTYSLNDNNWILSGWWKNQYYLNYSMELGSAQQPCVGPIKASVPGSVLADLFRANMIPDYNVGLNSCKIEWINNREWLFERKFIYDKNPANHHILIFDGLDFSGRIYLNGNLLKSFTGTFIPVKIDITNELKYGEENRLSVIFDTVTEVDGQYGFTDRIRIIKPRFNYVWDWCPRIIPVGIWKNAYIQEIEQLAVEHFSPVTGVYGSEGWFDTELCLKVYESGIYNFEFFLEFEGQAVQIYTLTENLKAGQSEIKHHFVSEDVKLWYPNGYGDQNIYKLRVKIFYNGQVCLTSEREIGFKKINVRHNFGTSGHRPYSLHINDHFVFLKGVNWVPVFPDYGSVTRTDYEKYLMAFKEMGCNILRVWGGAILEKEDFYEICDRFGLMVWQEFPQSSSGINNTPTDDPDFIANLEKVAREYIISRRSYPCHTVWCGGNELIYEGWKPVGEEHVNLAMLKSLCDELDAQKWFLPASPSGPSFGADKSNFGKNVHGDVHGPWKYLGDAEHYDYYNCDDALMRSEVGAPRIASLENLNQYKGEYALWPPTAENPLWVHKGAWWLIYDDLVRLFGGFDSTQIADYVKSGQYLQMEAVRYAVESCIRRQPHCSGVIVWMGNEPYQNAGNTSLLEFDGSKTPAYYAAKNAFSPISVSLKYNKIGHEYGELFEGDVFVICQNPIHETVGLYIDIYDALGITVYEETIQTRLDQVVSQIKCLKLKLDFQSKGVFYVNLRLEKDSCAISENKYGFTISEQYPFAGLN
jgi:beta-mannosidase